MKKASLLLNMALGLPFLLMLLMVGAGGIAGSATAQPSFRYAAQLMDIPPELLPSIKEIGERWDAPWPLLAAYVKVKHTWRIPIESRRYRYEQALEEDECEEQQPPPDEGKPNNPSGTATPPQNSAPGTPPPKPEPCVEAPPPTRAEIEAQWRADAEEWLKQQVWKIWGVTDPEDWHLRPEDTDFREFLRKHVNDEQWKQIRSYSELYEVWYPLREAADNKEFGEALEWEDYSRLLSLMDWDYAFPLAGGPWDFGDSWGADRPQNKGKASERHHGTDIMAPYGTPLVAIDDCTVWRKGWNYLGGWTITLHCTDNYYHYYAHMAGYADGISEGMKVSKGQVIGYVGDSGEGPEGTTGKMEPHLHYGLYLTPDGWVTNPFIYLFIWDEYQNR